MNLAILLASLFSWVEISAAERFYDYLEEIQSLEAKFRQEIINTDGAVLESSQGSLTLLKPNKFRWLYSSPLKQEIVSDGEKMWIYDPDLEQVVVNRKFFEDASFLSLTLKGEQTLAKHYGVESVEPENGHDERFLLVPSDPSSGLNAVYVSFNNHILSGIELKTDVNRVLKINLLDIETNRVIDPTIFEFAPPKNTDVIEGFLD